MVNENHIDFIKCTLEKELSQGSYKIQLVSILPSTIFCHLMHWTIKCVIVTTGSIPYL